jgi:hypothetical protein
MDSQIVAVYCLCDDLLKALYHHEDRQCQMSDAEVMTAAIIAMLYFRGNFEAARRFLRDQGYIPNMLSKSRFNRRLHRIAGLFLTLFSMLGETWEGLNESSIYVIDSFPIAACDNTASSIRKDTVEECGEVVRLAKGASFTVSSCI